MIRRLRAIVERAVIRQRRLAAEAHWAWLQARYPNLELAVCPVCPATAFLSQLALAEHLHALHGDS